MNELIKEKTRYDVVDLIDSWIKNRNIELVNTPGFEKYAKSLAIFKKEFEAQEEAEYIKYKKVYKIKLHDYFNLNENIKVIKVPGGWIYTINNQPVFVPFQKEET